MFTFFRFPLFHLPVGKALAVQTNDGEVPRIPSGASLGQPCRHSRERQRERERPEARGPPGRPGRQSRLRTRLGREPSPVGRGSRGCLAEPPILSLGAGGTRWASSPDHCTTSW